MAFRLNPKQSLGEPERLETKEGREEGRDKGDRRGSREMRLSEDANWQSVVSVRLLSKSKFHRGAIQTMDCTGVPQHHSGPRHTHTFREMLSVLSSSACLPASKPEWRWQESEWARAAGGWRKQNSAIQRHKTATKAYKKFGSLRHVCCRRKKPSHEWV